MRFVQGMLRLTAMAPIALVLSLMPASVRAEELSLDELYKLCSSFPFNSRCEGFEAPIPLDDREGTQVNCGLDLSQVDASGDCRLLIEGNTLVVYAEEGDPIEPLDNQKGSREIRLPFDQIYSTALRIWEREVDATAFLIGGQLYIQRNEAEYDGFERDYVPGDGDEREGRGKEDFSEVAISFIESPEAEGHRSNILRITATEEFGAYLLDQLTVGDISAIKTTLTTPQRTVDDPRQQLLDNNACIRCNLSGVDLSGLDLDDANLEGAVLSGANLSGADFSGAYLVGADLSDANLTETDLSRAKLGLANLSGAIMEAVDLHAASLPLANLENATMPNAELGGTHLAGANLTNVDLSEADLTEFTSTGFIPFLGLQRFRLYANLRGADLSGSVLTMADFDDAVLSDANLVGANLTGANLDDVALRGADLTGAIVAEEDLAEARLCGATMPDGEVFSEGCEEDEEI
ncbi:pentapeptide repeat-containing protein [Leptolyngbya cf. ectocarpi LEGE 11479]|uniref:Pentapeptide repeat-containing protein n=1 Tax=Leptolyngbya cf. ectocarpi LEGE 11479 TaxID=1828722 RepID=A0A928ZZ09_LEPEC|nr:pentapeptide repeat-containing protein [Leptolyngbya ectocarpi]MBE9069978.1 pentapeptide repeat-containing protein [Leptolyngbya cf. ectocarpi LEGE 11479]